MQYLAACQLLLAAYAYVGEVDIRTTDAGRVSLRVSSAPLSEVLDRMARQTGMKVIYDGPPPRTLVRGRQVENATLTDAVVDVLEGLGVGYALRLDATGAKVQTLLVLGAVKGTSPSAGASASTGAASSPAPRALVPPVRLPGFGNIPGPLPEDAEEEVPAERSEETMVEQRPGEARRPPVPITMPTIPTFPIGPISPLTLPAPSPSTQPTPPPPPPQ
jgi:hypothetical protein